MHKHLEMQIHINAVHIWQNKYKTKKDLSNVFSRLPQKFAQCSLTEIHLCPICSFLKRYVSNVLTNKKL